VENSHPESEWEQNAASEWSELDQIAFRKNLHDTVDRNLPCHDVDHQLIALGQLKSIVTDELARALRDGLNSAIHTQSQETYAEAHELAQWVSQNLDELGLAMKHPETGEPVRFALAKTPPKSGESWFVYESYQPQTGSRPFRIPRFPSIELCAAPHVPLGLGRNDRSR